jgi:GNAT superfamily N-acetyltransferase
MTVTITTASPADHTAWADLWEGFLDYYQMDLDPEISAHTWARIIAPDHRMTCRIAYDEDRAVGFAIHHYHCSSWVAGDDLYLEDLFVSPDARGHGVGRALIDDLIAIGRQNGWHRLYWNTGRDNAAARHLYDSLATDDGHIRYRLTL